MQTNPRSDRAVMAAVKFRPVLVLSLSFSFFLSCQDGLKHSFGLSNSRQERLARLQLFFKSRSWILGYISTLHAFSSRVAS